MNRVLVFNLSSSHLNLVSPISLCARLVLRLEKKDKCALDIFLVNSSIMKKIKKRFFGGSGSTNVLSFNHPKDFILPKSKLIFLGEIYLDLSYIKKNQQSIGLMVIHGILHLLGYDHKKRNERRIMEEREKELIEILSPKKSLKRLF